MDKEQELAINYAETINKQIEAAQETGDIPDANFMLLHGL